MIDDHWQLNGGLASHVHLLAGTGVVRVADSLPAALLAPAGCATATITCAARRVALSSEDSLVVIGCGMLGLTAVAYARDLGLRSVIACDIDEHRLDLAVGLGATTTCLPDELADAAAERGADVVLELSGHPDAVRSSLDVVDTGGRVALVGSVSPGPPVALDANAFVRNLTTVVGSHNYAYDDLVTAVEFLGATDAALSELVSPSYPISDIESAFGAASGKFPRVAVTP
jgi:threonine dehydrogenase-like Zn-dependent dehydrogenase